MAETERRQRDARSNKNKTEYGRIYTYVDGSAVRKMQAVPDQKISREKKASVSEETRRNRERALQMNLPYVAFLAAAAVITLFVCVNFLQLQAKQTRLQKEVTSLEARLNAAILENDSDFNRIMTGIDMEHVKDVAINELGMTYAKKSQIVTYEIDDRDYVRQYSEVPTE